MAHGDNGRKGDLLYDGKDMLPDEMEHVNESIGAVEQEFQLKLAGFGKSCGCFEQAGKLPGNVGTSS